MDPSTMSPADIKEAIEHEVYSSAQKCVRTAEDMPAWQRSQAYHDLLGFINGISTAIQGKRITDDFHESETLKNITKIFNMLEKLLHETPPDTTGDHRFGNKAYRTWSRKLHHNAFIYLQKALPQDKCQWLSELGQYFTDSFGNSVRIDYGTGHELAFIFFLCALFKANIFTEQDKEACALVLFDKYITFVRKLQQMYHMEPAGSQGVWSLDDYQFVPFIWGSAQLALNSPFEPAKFLDREIINEYKNDYLFIGCIDYISKVKSGHFAEHSNQLWSITAVPSWVKINSGLVRMYQKEILGKYPVIQHVNFGKLMSFKPVKLGTAIQPARLGIPPHAKVKSDTEQGQMPPPATSNVPKAERKPDEVDKDPADEVAPT